MATLPLRFVNLNRCMVKVVHTNATQATKSLGLSQTNVTMDGGKTVGFPVEVCLIQNLCDNNVRSYEKIVRLLASLLPGYSSSYLALERSARADFKLFLLKQRLSYSG